MLIKLTHFSCHNIIYCQGPSKEEGLSWGRVRTVFHTCVICEEKIVWDFEELSIHIMDQVSHQTKGCQEPFCSD